MHQVSAQCETQESQLRQDLTSFQQISNKEQQKLDILSLLEKPCQQDVCKLEINLRSEQQPLLLLQPVSVLQCCQLVV